MSEQNKNTNTDETKKRGSFKFCVVPQCKSTSARNPDKSFFSVPRNITIKRKWCQAITGVENEFMADGTSLHCCEDHFNLRTDVVNFGQSKIGKLRLKPEVVPHIFDKTSKNKLNGSSNKISNVKTFTSQTTMLKKNDETKKIECLEAVVNYTTEMHNIISVKDDANSELQANKHFAYLLEKVIYEWFDRAQRHKEIGTITNELFLKKAHEAKQIFCIQTLNTNIDWLNEFKKKHNITDLDMQMLRIESNCSPPSLDIYEIVSNVLKNNPVSEFFKVIKEEDARIEENNNPSNETLETILNDEQAIKHLKPLEEYVLRRDNFRAIGLISQLMEIFATEMKQEDS